MERKEKKEEKIDNTFFLTIAITIKKYAHK